MIFPPIEIHSYHHRLKKNTKGAPFFMEPGRSTEAAGAPARSMWRWRRRKQCDGIKSDEEKAAIEQLASIDRRRKQRRQHRRRRQQNSFTSTATLASALRAGLGVFLFAAVGLWSWDPLKVLLLERELRKEGGNDKVIEGELWARERVALAAKANLNAAVTVALLSAPASLGNTVGIAAQRTVGAALGCLAAVGASALGHAAAVAVVAGSGSKVNNSDSSSKNSSISNVVAASVEALAAVALGTLAVYLGQRARIQYGAQLFGVSLIFVIVQSSGSAAAPKGALELALSRGGGVVAGAALAAALAVAVLPQSAARGAGEAAEGSLFAVADLAEAALCGCGKEEEEEEEEEEKNDGDDCGAGEKGKNAASVSVPPPSPSSPSSPPLASRTAAAAKRVLSSLSELDDCLAWAPAETAVRAPEFLCGAGGRGEAIGEGGRRSGGAGGRLLFYLPSPRAALGLSTAPANSRRLPVPIHEITALSLSLRAATTTLTTIGAVRARRLPRSVREALRPAAASSPPPSSSEEAAAAVAGGGGVTSSSSASASVPSDTAAAAADAFELISPAAVAAWEALGDAWRDRERLRRRGRGAKGGGDLLSSSPSPPSFSGESADDAVAALSAAAASVGERARARAAAARAVALRETEEAARKSSTSETTTAPPTTTYRGMFDRVLMPKGGGPSSSSSTSAPPPSGLAAQARSRFLAEVALVSKVARDAERALECLRAAVEAL